MRSSADALMMITNEVLDFSKIESGELELDNRPFDLRKCVESAAVLFAARAEYARVCEELEQPRELCAD